MRNNMIMFIGAIALTFGLTSCKDILDVERDFSFTYELKLDSESNQYYSAELIDFREEVKVIKDYGDNIKRVDIKEITLWIRDHQGSSDQIIAEAEVFVANTDGSEPILISSLENQPMASIIQSPIPLNLNDSGINKLNRLIRQSPHSLQFILSGQLNESPAKFTAVFDFEGRMVANPL